MILANYSQFRHHFAAPGAPISADGWPAFPGPSTDDGTVDNTGTGSLLRANGFASSIEARIGSTTFTLIESPIGSLLDPSKLGVSPLLVRLHVRLGPDTAPPAHDFDWYVSMARSVGAGPRVGVAGLVEFTKSELPFLVTPDAAGNGSGVIWLEPNLAAIGHLLPGEENLLTEEAFATIFRHVHVYVRRRSDGAYQWCRLFGE